MYQVACATDAGNKYKQRVTPATPGNVTAEGFRMEDVCMYRNGAKCAAVVVADGHGSFEVGPGRVVGGFECASRVAEVVLEGGEPTAALFEAAQRAALAEAPSLSAAGAKVELDGAGRAIVTTRRGGAPSSHGSTLAALWLKKNKATFAYVGDTVGLHVPEGGEPVLLGEPHTVENEAECARMHAAGAKRYRSRYWSIPALDSYLQVSRAFGHFGAAQVLQTPDLVRVVAAPGDRFVVATDGLWDHVSPEEAASSVRGVSAQDGAARLVGACVKRGGTRDNVAVACVVVNPHSGLASRLRLMRLKMKMPAAVQRVFQLRGHTVAELPPLG